MRIRQVTLAAVRDVAPDDVMATIARADGLLWIDLDHTDEKGMALLPEIFSVRDGDLEDCYARTPVPKMHVYPDHHYTAINGLARGTDGRLYFQPLKIFQNPGAVVTVLGPTSRALPAQDARRELSAVHDRLATNGFRPGTSLELIGAIRREMMHTLEALIGSAAGGVSNLERRIMQTDPVRSERMLEELFALRHELQTVRTIAAQAHQSYSNLLETQATEGTQGELLAIDVQRVTELRQGYWHLVQTTDLEREYLQEMLDLFQTRVATELNRFIRRVTAWGTIGIGWTVVAGVYGMNFVHMPGLTAPWGFQITIGLTIVLSVILAWFFHRHGWL